jgi:flagellar biosynthesis GTPase FlhF
MTAIEELRALPRVSIQKTYISGGNATCVADSFVQSSDAEAIITRQQEAIDDLRRQLAEVRQERDEFYTKAKHPDIRVAELTKDLTQAREQLATANAAAAAMRESRKKFLERNAAEMRRKDKWIAELERAQETKYRRYSRNTPSLIYRTSDGDSVELKQHDGVWIESDTFACWQDLCDDANTYPCNEHGERIEDHIADTGKMVDDEPEPAKCKSCGIAYTDHLGIQGTCRELQEAKVSIDRLIRERDAYNERCDELRQQLAAQAPIVKVAEELRFLLDDAEIDARSYTVLIVPGEERARLQDVQKQITSALAKLRDLKGGSQ